MTEVTLPARSALAVEDTWNAESVYTTPADWDAELQALPPDIEAAARHQASMSHGPAELLSAFQDLEALNMRASKLLVYAVMAHHVDTADQDAARQQPR